jgi:hypothetical protein
MGKYDPIVGQENYSFCERVTATGSSPWHIRKLSESGPRPTGGADTPSLCGDKMGWDLNKVPITEHHLTHCCQKCAEAFRREVHHV